MLRKLFDDFVSELENKTKILVEDNTRYYLFAKTRNQNKSLNYCNLEYQCDISIFGSINSVNN